MEEYLTLDVVIERYSPGVLIFHDGDDVDADDISVMTVETPGALYKTTLEVAVPSADTNNYDFFVSKVPVRREMWERLKVPQRHLIVEVRADAVARYFKTRNNRSIVLPSVDVLDFKSIESRPDDSLK
jgi:hypothetical protein